MTPITLNRFDGGIAQSERPDTTNENSVSLGFDIFYDSHKLLKAQAKTVRLATSAPAYDINIHDLVKRDTDGLIIGVGTPAGVGGGAGAVRLYIQSSGGLSSAFTLGTATHGGDSFANGNAFMTLYKANFYVTYQTGSNTSTYKYVNSSTSTSVGDVGDFNAIMTRPIVHSQDNIMYVAGGKVISKYDGTTWTATALTLPYNITSMCEYGTYVAIACQTPTGGVIYLWGRDTSLTTLQDLIKVDSGALMIVENLGGVLTSVSQTPYDPNVGAGSGISFSGTRTLIVRQYTGSQMRKVKQATYSTTNEAGSTQSLINRKISKDGNLFFSTTANCLWRFGLNNEGNYILSQDMNIAYSGTNNINLYSLFLIGDYVGACIRASTGSPTDGITVISDTAGSLTATDTAYYTTTINPSMPIEDRKLDKQLKMIGVRAYSGSTSNGTILVEYSIDKGVTWTTAVSKAATFTTKLIKYYVDTNNDLTHFSSFTEIMLRVSVTYQIDILELFYDYDIIDAQLTA